MPQKVISPASVICGNVLRNDLLGDRVRSRRGVSQRNVIEDLREQIKCIEGRMPALDPGAWSIIDPGTGANSGSMPKHASVHALGRKCVEGGLSDDEHHRGHSTSQAPPSVLLCRQRSVDPDKERAPKFGVLPQAGVPAARFVAEDGGAFPRSPLRPVLPSSFSPAPWTMSTPWTLGRLTAQNGVVTGHFDITQMSLELTGVHEIKPAFSLLGAAQQYSGKSNAAHHGRKQEHRREDWAASLSAARFFMLALMARRVASRSASQSSVRSKFLSAGEHPPNAPILLCIPRKTSLEHGVPYLHGLRGFGLDPDRVLLVETGNGQDTLWALEEGLKSESLSLVVGLIDDVPLVPARRLALATQRYRTPCLLLTHPRTSPVGSTATRWRVAARPSARHPLIRGPASRHAGLSLKSPGARQFALTLERCRAAPQCVTEREIIVEWSDEALCGYLVAGLSNRSAAAGQAAIGAIE